MTKDLTLRTTTDRARTLSNMIDEESVVERQGSLKLNRVPASGVRSIEFILGEQLGNPTDPRDGWKTARAFVYTRDSDGIAVYSGQKVVTNTHPGTSGEAGQYGTADRINNRWIVRSLSCTPLPPYDEEGAEDQPGTWLQPEELSIDSEPEPEEEV